MRIELEILFFIITQYEQISYQNENYRKKQLYKKLDFLLEIDRIQLKIIVLMITKRFLLNILSTKLFYKIAKNRKKE